MGRKTREMQLDRELRFHIEQQIRDYVAAGVPLEEARRRVAITFGGVDRVKEECRDVRRLHWLDSLARDLRFALRMLRNSPTFTAIAILILALGIGANTITFSAINTLFLRPLPVERPGELVFFNSQDGGVTQSYPNYRDFRDRTRTLGGLFGYRVVQVALNANGANGHAWGYEVTGNYFDVLGVKAIAGRALAPSDDDKPGAHPVIVLSYGCWKRRFGGDPDIAGKTAKVNGLDYTILGVMPAGFAGTELFFNPEFWAPVTMEAQIEPHNDWLENRETTNIWIAGRLKPGITRAQAEAEMNAIAAQIGREHPSFEHLRVRLSPPGLVGNYLRGPVMGFTSVLMGVAGLVLLLACTNLAGLLLARASDRRREIAVRLALGASKSQLVRQLLTENLLLAMAGGAAGLLLAMWMLRLLAGWRMPIDFPANTEVHLDARVLVFTAAASVLTTLLFGLAPALQAAATGLVPALKNGPVAERLRRLQFRDLLVAAQVALSVILLAGSMLVVRSLQRSLTINFGFNPRNAVAVSVDAGLAGYGERHGREFDRRLIERVAALPGVEAAGLSSWLPLGLGQSTTSIYAEGKDPRPSEVPGANYYNISPGYLRAMQTRLIAGRDFDSRDRATTKPVAIVNQTFATKLLTPGDPIGKRFRTNPKGDWVEVVGVVEDGKYESLNDRDTAAVFWPRSQRYESFTTVVGRSPLPAAEVVRMIEREIRELDPVLPSIQAGSLNDHLGLALLPAHIAALMLGGFGALAILLAATGVYGLIAYAVSRRTREIGIRVAMGATRSQVLFGVVLRRASVLVGAGAAIGAATALAAGQLFSPVLYGVSPRDPASFAVAVLLMGGVAVAACLGPAGKAIRVDPAAALRSE
jgi:predicted permease